MKSNMKASARSEISSGTQHATPLRVLEQLIDSLEFDELALGLSSEKFGATARIDVFVLLQRIEECCLEPQSPRDDRKARRNGARVASGRKINEYADLWLDF